MMRKTNNKKGGKNFSTPALNNNLILKMEEGEAAETEKLIFLSTRANEFVNFDYLNTNTKDVHR